MGQLSDQLVALAPVKFADAEALPVHGFERDLGRDERMTVAVAADPTGEGEEGPATLDGGIGGVELGVDYAATVSCYDPDETGAACGACDACVLRRKGFWEADVPDPTRYQESAGP